MDRSAWVQQRRRSVEERYDTRHAPVYDENWGGIGPMHEQFLGRFLGLCRPGALVLDAACGTGKYWPLILASGRTVLGIDQSQGMLARAGAKFPAVPTEKLGLQEMSFQEAFDGAICVDALEMVAPEDWPLAFDNLHRAIKPAGYLYFTVEIAAEDDIAKDYAAGRGLGLPLIYGESAHAGGYHYYPPMEQVRAWLQAARFRLIEEAVADDYHHFLTQKYESPSH